MMEAGDEYTCAVCGGRYTTDWSEAEALAAARPQFGELPPDKRRLVCEDCYKRVMRAQNG